MITLFQTAKKYKELLGSIFHMCSTIEIFDKHSTNRTLLSDK
jgi:hypothetical protein